jgi:hypothetical protein
MATLVKDKIRAWKSATGSPLWASALLDIAKAINRQSHTSLPQNLSPWEVFFGRELTVFGKDRDLDPVTLAQLETLSDQRITELCAQSGDQLAAELQQSLELIPFEEVGIEAEDEEEIEIEEAVTMDIGEYVSREELAERGNTMNEAIQTHQSRVQTRMAAKYAGNHHIVAFEVGDCVTLKLPKDIRTSTDNLRLRCRVKAVPKENHYRLQTQWGILDKLHPTADLNAVPLPNWESFKAELLDAPQKEISMTYAAKQASTSTRVAVSCNCKTTAKSGGRCRNNRCQCIKYDVHCSQYCHSDDRECGNHGTIAEGTEASVASRDTLTNQEKGKAKGSRKRGLSIPERPAAKE